MKFVSNDSITDPRINLAIEEYILRHLKVDQSYLLFYVNEPSIIIGRNQNTLEEINSNYVAENNLHVVRRLSGGGAVYHDFGNLNFSFITKDDGKSFQNFEKFTAPVLTALQNLGVPARLEGRNDLLVGDRKISGNAMFSTEGRIFSHGTLLFNSDLKNIVSSLKVSQDKIASKGIKSTSSRVANIVEFLDRDFTMEEFKDFLLQQIFSREGNIPTYELKAEDWEAIEEIANNRYKNWDWNYGKSPRFNVQSSHRFPSGKIDVRLQVQEGKIKDCKFYGDFFSYANLEQLEQLLTNLKYDQDTVDKVLSELDLEAYFGPVTKEEILRLIF